MEGIEVARPLLVWLVVEVHCYLKPAGQVSIWISGLPLSGNKTLKEDVAVKLVGPVSGDEGERIAEVLQKQLGIAGVTVIEKVTADD
jgi:hypothetical protein